MFYLFLLLLLYSNNVNTMHFNGGTIHWQPIFPYINSSVVRINITQSYSWTFPAITCANNVPITTPGRSSQNEDLICMSECSSDGGYSLNPIDILTDCQTSSSSLGLLTSQRTVSINLTANTHFYLAHVGAAWVPINYPSVGGLQWSLVTYIDLRMRTDGFINTPPVANVVSPQFVVVNRTTEIKIPFSDINSGDDVRCRWSVYTPGSRRRRRFGNQEEKRYTESKHKSTACKKHSNDQEIIHVRKKRKTACSTCSTVCAKSCECTCAGCIGTTCSGFKCTANPSCSIATTTVETPGTIATTLSYANRQAIDECGGICYPGGVPSGTTLSDCTITFKGLVPNTWYAVALQVYKMRRNIVSSVLSCFSSSILCFCMI